MRYFEDQTGHRWGVSLDLSAARAMKRDLGVDVFDSDAYNAKLVSIESVDVLAFVLKGQIEAHWPSLKPDERLTRFAEVLEPVFAMAHDTLLEATIDFFDRLGRRELAEVLRKSLAVGRLTLERAKQQIDQMDPEKLAKLLVPDLPDPTVGK